MTAPAAGTAVDSGRKLQMDSIWTRRGLEKPHLFDTTSPDSSPTSTMRAHRRSSGAGGVGEPDRAAFGAGSCGPGAKCRFPSTHGRHFRQPMATSAVAKQWRKVMQHTCPVPRWRKVNGRFGADGPPMVTGSSRFTSPALAWARGLQPHAPISKALRFTIAGGESRWSLLLAMRSFWSRSGR